MISVCCTLVELEPRSRASPEQFAAISEFMESHGDLARPQQGAQGRLKADRLWQELTSLLNSIGGGIGKPLEKWKKVWADWKAKTKKKAMIRQREVSSTGGGPSCKMGLTAFEQRVLGIMGLNAVVGNSMIEEGGFDELPSNPPLPPTQSSIPTENPSQYSVGDVIVEIHPSFTEDNLELPSIPPPPSFQNTTVPAPPPVPTPPPLVPTPSTSSPISRPARRRRLPPASPSPVASPSASTPRRRRLRRIQTPFEKTTARFVEVENRRLQLEETRESNFHLREMERLRLEFHRRDFEEQQRQWNSRIETILTILLTASRPLPQP